MIITMQFIERNITKSQFQLSCAFCTFKILRNEHEQEDMNGPPYLSVYLRVYYIEILKPASKSLSLFEARTHRKNFYRVNNFKVQSYNNPFRGPKTVLSQGDCIK